MQQEPVADNEREESRLRQALYGFTPREDQVVVMIVRQGLTYEQIAERLGIQTRTVRGYAVSAFNKTGVNSREELVRWWYEKGPGIPEGRRREEEEARRREEERRVQNRRERREPERPRE